MYITSYLHLVDGNVRWQLVVIAIELSIFNQNCFFLAHINIRNVKHLLLTFEVTKFLFKTRENIYEIFFLKQFIISYLISVDTFK